MGVYQDQGQVHEFISMRMASNCTSEEEEVHSTAITMDVGEDSSLARDMAVVPLQSTQTSPLGQCEQTEKEGGRQGPKMEKTSSKIITIDDYDLNDVVYTDEELRLCKGVDRVSQEDVGVLDELELPPFYKGKGWDSQVFGLRYIIMPLH